VIARVVTAPSEAGWAVAVPVAMAAVERNVPAGRATAASAQPVAVPGLGEEPGAAGASRSDRDG